MPPQVSSKNQVRKLGKRLLQDDVSPDDELLLQRLLDGFDEVKTETRAAIVAMPWPSRLRLSVTARTKSRDTLVEKIRRQQEHGHGAGLPMIQDIAGVRVVLQGTLDDQDRVADRIAKGSFWDSPPTLKDRRKEPIQGYRAVHLTGTTEGGWRIEVQVRTHPQDTWANLFERLGDVVSRQIRYPDFDPQSVSTSAANVVRGCIELSLRRLATLETHENTQAQLRRAIREGMALGAWGVGGTEEVVDSIPSGPNSLRSYIRTKLLPVGRTIRAEKAAVVTLCCELTELLD